MKRSSAYLENDDGMVAKRTKRNPRRKGPPKGQKAISAYQKAQMSRIAKSVLNRAAETKYIFDNDNSIITSTGTVFAMNNPVRGDAPTQYEGAWIDPVYYHFKGRIITPVVYAGGTPANQYIGIRMVFFQWHPDTQTDTPTLGEMFYSTTAPYTMTNANPDYRRNYTILYDYDGFVINSSGNPDAVRSIAFTVPASALKKISFNDGAITGTDHIFCAAWSTETTNGPSLVWQSKMGFKDL